MANRADVPQRGYQVFTLDLQPIGTVGEVWPDVRVTTDNITENTSLTPDAEPGPLARPGVFLVKAAGQDYYVPFGAIDRIEGNRVILGVPALAVDEQGWTERPRQLAR